MSDVRLSLHWAGARRHLRFPDLNMASNFLEAARQPYLAVSERQLRVVDVGACCGGWTLAMAERLPNAEFECFEPWPDAWPYLEHNLRGVTARIHKVAASDKFGLLGLSPDPDNLGKTSHYNPGEKVPVKAVPLDEPLNGPVDILKIDAEGHEVPVLVGAERLLAEHHPWVIVELLVSQQAKAGRQVTDVEDWLRAHGYGAPTRVTGNDWLFRKVGQGQ